MHNWFKGAATFEKVMESGMHKKVKEWYLVDALSFTEAEARLIEEIRPFISGEFVVVDIKRGRYSEVFFGEGDTFWEIKIVFITLDEKSSAEKMTPAKALVQSSSDINDALAFFEEQMKGTLADYHIKSCTETTLMDIFPLDLKTEDGEKVEELAKKQNAVKSPDDDPDEDEE